MSIQKLRPSDIHVWVAKRELILIGRGEFTCLPEDEQTRLKKMSTADERIRFVQARTFLRKVLSRYVGLPPDRIVFKFNRNRKPFLAVEPRSVSFNMSHCQDLILVAVSRQDFIGVDVEELRECEDVIDVATRFFSKKEAQLLNDVAPETRATLFFRLWTGKEACIKAVGGRVTDSSLKRTVFQCVSSRWNSYMARSGLHVQWFSPTPRHLAAVASKNQAPRIHWRRWD